ncbi:hypothetical protein BZG02_04025 [Labilibaculum filiforme]|uniref:F5/8 type C domain-containing protein n=1 Tax=Labilibaculum filiforme TaxID=1940526 RepID=A0A2N3I429_9BACT|nr:glycoside hydrolase family 38 C-terminal domain-containing protein [Labilibaculum filiforme]PKQ65013.1 hypothetical protein BZG02_04025 [Labilibaculum filiforme]
MNTRTVQVFIIAFCFFLSSKGQASEPKEETVKVFSSSVVKRNNGNPLQMGIIEIADRSINSIEVELQFPEGTVNHHFTNLEEKHHTVTFEFPVLKERTNVQVRIVEKEAVLFEKMVQFSPPKIWKIYDVQVSHHDLGYADYYHMMRRDVREMGIEMAMEFARKTDSWPKESQFHWTVETSEPMIQYLSKQPEDVLTELFERIEKGQISLGGVHNSVTTEHLGYEAMARQFYTPNRYVCDWFNTEPSKTALNDDVVGFTRALALYSKESDIPYSMFGRNSTVKAFDKAEDDMAFYWQSPDKDSKMTLYKVWHYYSPDRLVKYNVPEVAALCGRYEAHTNYPYSCLLAEASTDFGMPLFENVEGIKKWNEEYSNPVLVSGTFDMYFDDLSSQQDKESFKIYTEDAPNAWADEDLTDVEYANKARRLQSKLPATEKWATIASAVTAKTYPWLDIYQAYFSLLMWGEHTNGAYAEGPIYVPPSLDDPTAANATYYELEQEMHRDLVRESEQFTNKVEAIANKQLESQITTHTKNTLVLRNSLVRKRSDVVYVEIPKGKGLKTILDNSTGNKISFQYVSEQKVVFYSTEVPSMGYKTYALEFSKNKAFSDFKTVQNPKIENDYYVLEFDSKSGGIKSLFDKKLNRELVDQEARFKLNEYYYERFETNSYNDSIKKYQPESASFKLQEGPLATVVISEVKATGAQNIVQKVTIYKNCNRIDFEVTFDKDDSGRTLQDYRNYSAIGKEGLFYCLPFDIPNFTIQHELAGGVMEPVEDQFEGSSTDYYGIQNFSDISNDEWGITLATIEPNLIEYGKPRPAYWSTGDDYEHIMKKADDSHFYLYLLNNMFFTNVRQSQPGPKKFRWSVRSHARNWEGGKAYQFGRDFANPLTAIIVNEKKNGTLPANSMAFIELDSEDILCSTIKPAEANGEGYIMRFVEQSGKEQIVTVKANFIEKIQRANLTNLVEVDRDYPLDILGENSFKFIIPAFGLRTIRVVPAKQQLPVIKQLKANAVADRMVKLNWDLTAGERSLIAYYKIYRSTKSDFEPSTKTYIGNTDLLEFIDVPVLNVKGWQSNNIQPETKYYYKIQAIGVGNRNGTVSDEIAVKTKISGEQNLKPNAVQGLVSTLVSSITNHNYVGLYFYTNIEEDVSKYVIYRSTEKEFTPKPSDIIAEMDVTQEIKHVTPHGFAEVTRPLKAYNRQLYVDEDLQPFETYYYKVAAKDDAGQIGEFSNETSTTAGIGYLRISGTTSFRENTEAAIHNPNNNDWEIRYTTDGTLPIKSSVLYTKPIIISDDLLLTASLFLPQNDKGVGVIAQEFQKVKDYKVVYNSKYNDKWQGAGDLTLIDYYRGEESLGHRWQGFKVNDMDIIIDMKELKEIESVAVGCLQNVGNWVFFPNYIEVATSEDGKNFQRVGRLETIKEWQRLISKKDDLMLAFPKTKCRYIKVFAKNIGYNPVWHNFSGAEAWLFVDEILIK